MKRIHLYGLIGALVLAYLTIRPAFADGPIVHRVEFGETLAAIARIYRVSVTALISANRLTQPDHVLAGQRLVIPAKSQPAPPTQVVVRLRDVPLLGQQQTLTCEEAAAAMASHGRVSEARLVRVMPRSANPFKGIRGRTNARLWGTLDDYGVHAQGLQLGLRRLGLKSTVLYEQPYESFKSSIIARLQAGQPVIWWTTYHEQRQQPARVWLRGGQPVKLVRFEHAVVIVGVNASGFTYHDPFDRSVRHVSFGDHRRVSAYFDNMALYIH